MKRIFSLVLTLALAQSSYTTEIAVVDRVKENTVTLEIGEDMTNIPLDYFNIEIAESMYIPISTATVEVYEDYILTEDGIDVQYYMFDGIVEDIKWCLALDDIGFIPIVGTTYTLYYYENNTDKDSICYINYEHDCECYVYDDIFLLMKEVK